MLDNEDDNSSFEELDGIDSDCDDGGGGDPVDGTFCSIVLFFDRILLIVFDRDEKKDDVNDDLLPLLTFV